MNPSLEPGQQVTLLTTKLFVPLPRVDLVSRPRLFDRLDEGLRRELILLAAPAGFGKSTLLSAWAAERRRSGMSVAWLTLDTGDNDAVRFLTHLISAIHSVQEGLANEALHLLRSPQPVPEQELLTVLLNALAQLPGDLALILDDYHVVASPSVHKQLGFVLERMPRHLHLFIASRTDPPLPLARLRARSALLEVGAEQLRFSRPEALTFFRDTMKLELEAADVEVLEGRTEGWVAGMQLAALSLRDRPDARQLISRFAGSQRYVLDYLTEEVLQQQPAELQRFLLETCLLERLCGPLCDAVTGGSGGQQQLESLERAHLFLVPLDDERRWYRYHHLFAQALRTRLEAANPGLETELHRRAADWFSGAGQCAEAIPHMLAARDLTRAADLMEGVIDDTISAGELTTIAGWLEALPDALLQTRPLLCVGQAHLFLLRGQDEEAARRLDDAERQLSGSGVSIDRRLAGRIAALRTLIAAGLRLDAQRAITLGEDALRLLPPDEVSLRGTVLWGMGIAHELRGDVRSATLTLEKAVQVAARAHNRYVEIQALGVLLEALQLQGRLRAAHQVGQRALELAADGAGRLLPMAVYIRLHLVGLLCELDQLESAQRQVDAALESACKDGNLMYQVGARIYLAKMLWVQRSFSAALDALQAAERQAGEADLPHMRSRIQTLRVRVWTSLGHVDDAQRWEAECRPGGAPDLALLSGRPLLMIESEEIIVIRLRLVEARFDDALARIGRWLPNAREGHRWARVIELKILEALGCQAKGAEDQARSALQEALRIGEAEGFVRSFLQEGPALRRLLEAESADGPQARYARLLLARDSRDLEPTPVPVSSSGLSTDNPPAAPFPPSTPVPSASSPPSSSATSSQPADASATGSASPDALSEREREILQCIADGMSNQDIGEEVAISVATVKWHITNILGKLRAKNRTEAVARARRMGLF